VSFRVADGYLLKQSEPARRPHPHDATLIAEQRISTVS
jgi:hypothetical protein